MVTSAPAAASRRAQASPSPEAPPVMSAPTPEICIGSASKPIAQLILQDLHGGVARKLVDHLELLWDLLHHQSCIAAVLLHLGRRQRLAARGRLHPPAPPPAPVPCPPNHPRHRG